MYLAVGIHPFLEKKRARSIYLTLIYLSIPTLQICGTKAKNEERKKKGKNSLHQQMMTFLGRFSTDDDDDDLRACTAASGKA